MAADGMTPEKGTPHRTLAEKINYLFDTIRRPNGKPHSSAEVASAMANRDGDLTISGSYIHLLRNGQRDNPTMKHLVALAEFFDVPPAYFIDEGQHAAIVRDIETLRGLSSAGVTRITARLGGLSPDSLMAIHGIVETYRAAEQLDSRPPSAAGNS